MSPTVQSGIEVDGARPAVSAVTALPHEYRLTAAERLILLTLACDSYRGDESRPGYAALAQWTGLSQGVLVKSLRSLCSTTEHRPALLSKITAGGRHVTVWRFQLEPVGDADRLTSAKSVNNSPEPVGDADQLVPAEPVSEPVGQPVSEPVGNADDSLTLPYPDGDFFLQPSVPSASKAVEVEKDQLVSNADRLPGMPAVPHKHEPNAWAAFERVCRESRLPFTPAELLPVAYALGGGDPWTGYTVVRDAFERSFADAHDPRAMLVKRLRDAGLNDTTVLARLARRAA